MSLIIENKEALDSLANSIINANLSVDDTMATKGRLAEIVQNIIPEKAKFASGTFTPTEDLTTQNSPWLDFSLGTDDEDNRIIPNLIFVFQPHTLLNAEVMNASCYRIWTYGVPLVNPFKYPNYTVWTYNLFKRAAPATSSGTYYTGSGQGASPVGEQEADNYTFTKNKFKLQPLSDTYPFLAGHPIVWLQIKF